MVRRSVRTTRHLGIQGVVTLVILASLSAACASTSDTGGLPEGIFVPQDSVATKWISGNSAIRIAADGRFSGNSVTLNYYNCETDGVRAKSGDGKWETVKGRQRTELLLEFDDGCTATLWAGKGDEGVVLWGYGKNDDLFILNAAASTTD